MSEMENLRKYFVEGMVQEELIKEQSEPIKENKLNEESSKASSPTGEIDMNNLTFAIRKLLSEAILGEMDGCMGPGPAGLERKENPKIQKSLKILRVLQDALWAGNRFYGQEEVDIPELDKELESTNERLIKLSINELYKTWFVEAVDKEVPDIVGHIKIADVNPGDSVVSPQGIEYSVENIKEDKVSIIDKSTNKRVSIDLSTAKKWKK